MKLLNVCTFDNICDAMFAQITTHSTMQPTLNIG